MLSLTIYFTLFLTNCQYFLKEKWDEIMLGVKGQKSGGHSTKGVTGGNINFLKGKWTTTTKGRFGILLCQ